MKFKLIAVLGIFCTMMFPAHAQMKFLDAPLTVPNVTEAMLTPDFWLAKIQYPDRVIMTPEQIRAINERNKKNFEPITDINGNPHTIERILVQKDRIGLQFNVEEPLTIRTFSGDSLRTRMDIHGSFLEARTFYDYRDKQWNDRMKAELYSLMSRETIPDRIAPMYGILVKHTHCRAFPTIQAAYTAQKGWLDEFQSNSLDMASPVAVLHTSSDGAWFYVRGETSFGWIPAENVALGAVKEIQNYLDSKDILVCLEHKTPIYSDENMRNFLTEMYLGASVRLLGSTPVGWRVSVPVRNYNGTLRFVDGWVRPGAIVSEGYQPYTQRNVLNTMFRLQGRPYGWADANFERDCCGTIRVVFRTFGIKMGRWTSHQLHASEHVVAFPRNTDKEVKYSLLDDKEPGITIVGNDGHINMYIGNEDGKYYVIHQGGYNYRVDESTTMMIRRVGVNCTELEGGSNIGIWTEITTIKP